MKKTLATPGSLYVVATPLGNLEDITYRAVEILKKVPVIACEDTRHSGKLLSRYSIKARLISYHEHNEQTAASQVVSLLSSGFDVALISDAGTPGISDPGYRVVKLALEQGLEVIPIPGPSALTAALSVSGLPTDSFCFAGWVPAREKELEKTLAELSSVKATLIFYCPARKIRKVIITFRQLLGNRRAVICRELTKIHEEILRGLLSELEKSLEARASIKGEIVLIVEGSRAKETEPGENLAARLAELLDSLDNAGSMGAKSLTALAAEKLGSPRNRVYPMVCAYLNKLKDGESSRD